MLLFERGDFRYGRLYASLVTKPNYERGSRDISDKSKNIRRADPFDFSGRKKGAPKLRLL